LNLFSESLLELVIYYWYSVRAVGGLEAGLRGACGVVVMFRQGKLIHARSAGVFVGNAEKGVAWKPSRIRILAAYLGLWN
jgi:hypothetical protein